MPACPLCSNPMVSQVADGVTIDACAGHGLWLDHAELLLLTEAERHRDHGWWEDLFRRAQRPPVDPSRLLACPTCAQPMSVERYHEVHIDWCATHGVWLDEGEMEAIQNNLRLDPMFVRGMALRLSEGRF